MKWNFPLTSNAFDRRLSLFACFAGALIVLLCSVMALQRYCTTAGELITGILAALALTISLMILGIVTGPGPAKP